MKLMRMRIFTTGIVAVLVWAGACLAGDPVVSSVRASQCEETKLVDIWYDVADSDGDRLAVTLSVTDNGATVPAASLSGDVGAGVAPGKGKHVVWNASKDWAGKFSENVRVAVKVDDRGTPDVTWTMVLIPAGNNSGTNPLGARESYNPITYPQTYSLTVSAFFMDATEVTKAQWDAVYTWAVANGYGFENAGSGKAADHPVQMVNWYDCVKWCNARSQKEGRTPCYTVSNIVYKTGQSSPACDFVASGYRLPTSIEWEYAARGGLIGRRFPWGDRIDHTRANYSVEWNWWNNIPWWEFDDGYSGFDTRYATGSYPYTSPVGAFAANGYGLYDMSGNVFEWCWDLYDSFRETLGGSWAISAPLARCGMRTLGDPNSGSGANGFRAVYR
jgi:formylglycine-generating enzyme required for sulfatase activity